MNKTNEPRPLAMDNRVPYALRDGEMIHVGDVESGLACGCFCPGCNSPLVAKKGKKMTHHFSHHVKSNCASLGESATHWVAKNWFFEEGKVSNIQKFNYQGKPRLGWDGKVPLDVYGNIILKNIELEKKTGPLIPDVKGLDGNTPVWLEIAVTHKCDDRKIEYCKQNGIILLEVVVDRKKFRFDDYEEYLSGIPVSVLSWPASECAPYYKESSDAYVDSFWKNKVNEILPIEEEKSSQNRHDDACQLAQELIDSTIRFIEESDKGRDSIIVNWKDGICPWVFDDAISRIELPLVGSLSGWNGIIYEDSFVDGFRCTVMYVAGKGKIIFTGSAKKNWKKNDSKGVSYYICREAYDVFNDNIWGAINKARIGGVDRRAAGCQACKFNKGCIDLPCKVSPLGGENYIKPNQKESTISLCSYPSKSNIMNRHRVDGMWVIDGNVSDSSALHMGNYITIEY